MGHIIIFGVNTSNVVLIMAQHFLLPSNARTLSVAQVARMTDEEARAAFRAIRWAATDGEPVCPRCGCCAG
jgi:hypothetical protein